MLKKGMGKSILMTVLITGNVVWGGHSSIRRRGAAAI